MAGRENTRVNFSKFFGQCILALLSYGAFAQDSESADSTEWVRLDEVEVNALALSNSKFDYGGMIGTISPKRLEAGDVAIAARMMNEIPGVYWHSGALNTNRITIRGIGSRSPFSTNKIRAYYQDIPLTDGGGETALEDIDLGFVGEIEVQKGANSSLYGSGLGGTVFLRKKKDNRDYIKLNTGVGSYEYLKNGLTVNMSSDTRNIRIGFQDQRNDGYRDNNSSDRQTFFTSASIESGNNTFNFLGLYLQQKAFIPSSLGITAFTENPKQAAANWGNAKGFEDYSRWLAGVSWEKRLRNNSKIVSGLFSIGRVADEYRPFNILEDQTSGFGLRSRWEKTGETWSFHAGFETYFDTYKAEIFQNTLPADGSMKGALLSENKQPRKYINLFSEARFIPAEKTSISFGLNLNQTAYKSESLFPNQSTTEKTFDLILSPRVSVTQSLGESVNVFATLSHGFSPPSVDDSSNPDGTFNNDILPEIGWNREIGFKYFSRGVNLELSLYSMDIRDLLVTRRTTEDVVFGINAGSTLHNGLEVDADFLLLNQENFQLTGDLTYSLSDFEFSEFVDDGDVFSGNQLTGVPKHQASFRLGFESGIFRSGVSWLFVDEIPITDSNDVFSESYNVVDAYAGVVTPLADRWSLRGWFYFNNVLDEKYASMLSINAGAFGSAEPRYYYPGLPRNYQVTLSLSYEL